MEIYEINIKELEGLELELREFNKKYLNEIDTFIENKMELVTNANELFGHMLRLFRKYFGLTQEEMGLILGGTQFQYSKAGYAKLERGDTAVNIECIFHLSRLTGLNHITIFEIYDQIIKAVFYNSKLIVQFTPDFGVYGMGQYMQRTTKIIEKKKNEHRYLKLDQMIGKENLNNIKKFLDNNINPFVRDNIKLSVERAVSLKLNKGIKINIPKSIFNDS
ncbi:MULTISPECIES: helix-turn-helix domain-containing protein [Acinetobacter calcoaceticus/baumannii complex]|uniref:helix-turn-helix domain-containing protein n=1 Tax=Acinetobacter calcoaceticus/baumannii complex TaxID=909768 RepID=UPI000A3C8D8A|nr:helix-turn-helix transcriptional regulator [Acinetobacter baumannii]OTT28129.1 hypothetical protein CAS81_11015 [Acinetobacter baumannii]TPS15771.1 helix-turn-helix domain-containing protein [Acinetobacter baumannii]HDI2995378.1 helix-turn-helix domain-containing protein [Acinetobacter baumannii]HDI5575637.1 helix-turn-helix domain-containing protein [Acinetobacter baumannii]